MRLYELAYCCRLYGEITRYDASMEEMRRVAAGGLDLHDPGHTMALLRWLNHWGCRQFALDYHSEAGQMLAAWGDRWLDALPVERCSIGDLDVRSLETAADAYADLKDRQASKRRLSGNRMSVVTVGPTGAAKVLHALRPSALPPWDDPIRAALRRDGSRRSYFTFLQDVQGQVRELEAEAALAGITAADIPRGLGRPASSLPKMIDEYYWVTITRGHVAPTVDELERWRAWSTSAAASSKTTGDTSGTR